MLWTELYLNSEALLALHIALIEDYVPLKCLSNIPLRQVAAIFKLVFSCLLTQYKGKLEKTTHIKYLLQEVS